MCEYCGCGQSDDNHSHEHDHDHPHDHDHGHHKHERIVEVRKDILHENSMMAERNRGWFEARNIRTYNIVGSPGSGKTSLLEKTVTDLGDRVPIFVIEGDQQGSLDAERIRKSGGTAYQINTGYGCHLDAAMVHKVMHDQPFAEGGILFIENVGNLVCPTLFDLGEHQRIIVTSVTEGNDKPLKYPYMFRSSHLCIISKTDILPYLESGMEEFRSNILRVNPEIHIIELSVKSGEGIKNWYSWLGIL